MTLVVQQPKSASSQSNRLKQIGWLVVGVRDINSPLCMLFYCKEGEKKQEKKTGLGSVGCEKH